MDNGGKAWLPQVTDFISRVGIPAAMAFYVMVRIEPQLQALNISVAQLVKVVEFLSVNIEK